MDVSLAVLLPGSHKRSEGKQFNPNPKNQLVKVVLPRNQKFRRSIP